MMLGIFYGLRVTVNNMKYASSNPPLVTPTACKNDPKPWPTSNPCITIAFTDDNTRPDVIDRNWKTMRIVAKHLGLSISPTVGDRSQKYDVVYMRSKSELTDAYFEGKTYIKFPIIFYSIDNFKISYLYTNNNTNSLNAGVGMQDMTPMNFFGFAKERPNGLGGQGVGMRSLLTNAHIGLHQSITNGETWDKAMVADVYIREKSAYDIIYSDRGSSGDAFFQWGAPIVIWVSLFASQLSLSSHIAEDRRKKLRLGMVMMGLNTGSYQLSWFLYHIFLSAIYSAIALGIGYACKFPFFLQTNGAVIFLLYWCTSVAAIGFTMMTCAIVHHPAGHMVMLIIAFIIGLVLATLGSSPFAFVFWTSRGAKQVWSVNYAFQFSNIMANINYRIAETSDQANTTRFFRWSDVYKHITPYDLSGGSGSEREEMQATLLPMYQPLPSVSDSFLWLLLCGVLGLIVSIYLEIVFPREIGSPQSFFFFFMPSYWGFDSQAQLNVETVAHRANKMSDVASDLDPDILAEYNDVMNRVSVHDPTLALAVTKISKVFQKGRRASDQDTRAVDAVTLGADTGSVLGIVGHNGAGKTTLMSMLCGVVPVSTGDGRVFGHSISSNMTYIHGIMGVCPQEDVLWPELTPHEHLKLFAMLKRIPRADHERVIADSLNEVGLYDVRHRIANKLSGGMKRRLSVAIALIGQIKILMLDEPTAGLDPRNRLEIWNIIERVKQNRVVILTTHSMLEAATLSDKIAVMAVGRLRAVGRPQHLVKRYGKGHQITLVCKISKSEQVKQLMDDALPDAQLEIDTGARLTYSLAASKSRQLPDFCKYMENQHSHALLQGKDKEEGGEPIVEDWGISQTTLEQVFLKLTHGGGNTAELDGSSMQLNIAMESDDNVLGFVGITPTTTLDEVREKMLENEAYPREFSFVMARAPVTKAQERSTIAFRAIPLIELRLPKPQRDQHLEPSPSLAGSLNSDIMDPSAAHMAATIAALNQRIETLETQLHDRNQLAETVNKLQLKIEKLKKKLKAAQGQKEEPVELID